MITLIIATGNAHKTGEIQAILGSSYHYLTLRDLTAMPAVVEDAATFAGNATKKSVELAQWLRANCKQLFGALTARGVPAKSNSNEFPANCFVLADDSGLEVDYLRGAPGIHSARFANLETGKAGNASDAANRGKLLRLLNRVPDSQRRARFRCAIALTPVLADETKIASPVCYADELEFQTGIFEGICEGRIIESSRGSGGFGYDPLFVPEGYDVTFAELGEEAKNRISHRSRALAALQEVLSKLQASCD